MWHQGPRDLTRILKRILLLLLLAPLPLKVLHAQPGTPMSPQAMEKYLRPAIEALTKQIESEPQDAVLLLRRADLYGQIYYLAGMQVAQFGEFGEKALTDLSTAIALDPKSSTYVARARLYRTMWSKNHPAPQDTKALVAFFLKNRYVDAMTLDLLTSIRLDPTEKNADAFAVLSSINLECAQNLAKPALMRGVTAQGESSSVWSAFDIAIEYRRKKAEFRYNPTIDRGEVAAAYAAKGSAATKLRRYDLAEQAFVDGEQYAARTNEACTFYSAWGDFYLSQEMFALARERFTKAISMAAENCPVGLERRADSFVAEGDPEKALDDYNALLEKTDVCCKGPLYLKRVRVYLKLNQPQKALAEIEISMQQPMVSTCPQIYLLRAETNKLLGNVEGAAADEQRAAKFKDSNSCLMF